METHYAFATYRIEKMLIGLSKADKTAVREAFSLLGYTGAISVLTAIQQRKDGDSNQPLG